MSTTKKLMAAFSAILLITAATKILLSTTSILLPSILILSIIPLLISNRRGKNTPPGPFSLPIFGNWLQVGNDLNHRFLAAMSTKYGSPFLLKLGSRSLVVVSDPTLASAVLHTQGVEFGSRPRNVVFDIFTGNGQDMVFTAYGDHWRRMRRIMTLPFFTTKVVHLYRNMWQQEMDLVLTDLHGDPVAKSDGVVIRRRLQLMLYNIMYRMMFDAGFSSVTDPLFLQATKFNSERSRLSQSFEYNYGDYIPFLRPFLRGYLNRCRDLQSKRLSFFQDNYVDKRREHLAQKRNPNCAMDHIIVAEQNGELTPENVIYIVENINVAAIETTLWSMEWAIAELVNHPHIQSKLRREIYDVLGDDPVTEESLDRLPYLQAVVKETLRLHTPIPLLVPHMNLEEARLGEYRIPEGTKVVVNAWWMANNPEWWERPEEFRPERFVDEEGKGVDAVVGGKVDFRFMPFGVGRRSCPGIILAMPILGLIVGKMVREFEMRPPPGAEKIDVAEKGGQFSLHIANHSVVAFSPVKK